MESSPELRELMLQLYVALSGGELSFLDQHVSTAAEVRGIGTDPHEWWTGSRLLEAWKQQSTATGSSMPLSAANPEAYCEGSVGWVADWLTLTLPNGADVPVRMTAVFHRENGDWKLVQCHSSLGA